MLTELAANRVNMNTAANPGCQWLFPGQRVGQPLMPIGLRRQHHELGIPLTITRSDRVRWAAAVQYATAWAASSTGLL